MKCPIDQTEMEKGDLVGTVKDRWVPQGYNILNQKGGLKTIIAYKCPKCGKVELKVEEKS